MFCGQKLARKFFRPVGDRWRGLMKDWTASYSGGLYGLALTAIVSAFVCAFFLHIPNRTAPEAMPPVGAHAG